MIPWPGREFRRYHLPFLIAGRARLKSAMAKNNLVAIHAAVVWNARAAARTGSATSHVERSIDEYDSR
jgi:hypothetical protein